MWYLLEETKSNICFSTIIPTSNNTSLNKSIEEVNTTVEKMVGNARQINPFDRPCLFTYNNKSVAYHNQSLPGRITLSQFGKNLMWKRLADVFRKTLRLNIQSIVPTETATVMNRATNKKHKHNKSCVSWNINDCRDRILGSKDTDEAFMDTFKGCHLFCLQETKGEIKIENYHCYNKLRTDSRSGGLCIGIHRDIADYLQVIDTSKYSNDFQVARISGKLVGDTKDIILINVYDSPETSSYKQRKKSNGTYNNTLDSLSDFLTSIKTGTNLIIAGDFNARTGNLNSFTRNNDSPYHNLCNGDFYRKSHPVNINRASKDKKVNERGNKLLEFATEWNIAILNGCTIGDVLGD